MNSISKKVRFSKIQPQITGHKVRHTMYMYLMINSIDRTTMSDKSLDGNTPKGDEKVESQFMKQLDLRDNLELDLG